MTQTKTIQLLRSQAVSANLEAAKQVLLGVNGTGAKTAKDGEIVLVRYYANNDQTTIKSILGIYHKDQPLEDGSINGWTILEDVASSVEGLEHLQNEVNAIETSTGLKSDGTKDNFSGDDVLQVVEANDSLLSAISKIADRIGKMDKAASAVDGQVVTTVSEVNGVVSEAKEDLTDIKMGGYSKTADTGAIAAADTLEVAVSKLENGIASTTVKSTDKTVNITDNSGKDLSVNIDGTTLVKNSNTGVISSDLKILKEITNLESNVKEQYKLVYGSSTTAIGDVIKVYKDSALLSVKLLHATDSLKPTYDKSNDTWTDIASASQTEANLALCYAYENANGTVVVEAVPVGDFLRESEFKNGLQVVGGEVSVLIDSTSEKVTTAQGVRSDVLTVSPNGVKVDNIQAAIDYAVANATGDLAVSAQGDNYITAAVDANNNKKINVTADVQDLTASAGTPGVYNSTTGAQTTAPVAGTLSGVAGSLGDAADIATKVKTYVDGAIAIEGARSDAKNLADLKTVVEGLDGTATASIATNLDTTPSADFKVLTKVAEVDGKIVETTVSNGSTAVTLKKLAATGAAADVSIADTGSLITATDVEGALQEIATNVRNNALVNNDVIVVTPDTTNNNTKLSVTTGNGLEKTGTNNDTLSVKAGDGITVDANGVAVDTGLGLEINSTSKAVDIKIDPTSAKLGDGTDGMLTVSANGLKLNDTWDCGVF